MEGRCKPVVNEESTKGEVILHIMETRNGEVFFHDEKFHGRVKYHVMLRGYRSWNSGYYLGSAIIWPLLHADLFGLSLGRANYSGPVGGYASCTEGVGDLSWPPPPAPEYPVP